MNLQQLKRRGTLAAGTAARVFTGNTFCYLPYLRLIPKPSRKNGISVRMTTKNEEEWIGLNLQSLKDFADEIIIADASTDKTPEIIEKTASKYNLNLNLIRCESDQIMGKTKEHAEHANLTLKKTSFRWVFWWEGDFIAKNSIVNLKEEILSLSPNIYHAISIPAINLEGDFFHQRRGNELNIQSRLHTYSDDLVYEDKGRFEALQIPFYYKPSYKFVLKKEYHIFHMASVKNTKKLLFREFWTDWRELRDYNKFPKLEDYVRFRIKKDWGVGEIEEAARYYVNKIRCKNLVPYDKERFGDYPELLETELKNPRYKVIYKDGEIVGRNDTLTDDTLED